MDINASNVSKIRNLNEENKINHQVKEKSKKASDFLRELSILSSFANPDENYFNLLRKIRNRRNTKDQIRKLHHNKKTSVMIRKFRKAFNRLSN